MGRCLQVQSIADQARNASLVAADAASAASTSVAVAQDAHTTALAAAETADATNAATVAAVSGIFTPAPSITVITPTATTTTSGPAPARTPRASTSALSPGAQALPLPAGGGPSGASTAAQQAAFLGRLVDVVKRQSGRLHAQYSDAEETGVALAQVGDGVHFVRLHAVLQETYCFAHVNVLLRLFPGGPHPGGDGGQAGGGP